MPETPAPPAAAASAATAASPHPPSAYARYEPWRRLVEIGLIGLTVLTGLAIAVSVSRLSLAWSPTFNAIGWLIAATALLAVPAHWVKRSGPVLTIAAAVLMTADLAANNGPNESTARASTNASQTGQFGPIELGLNAGAHLGGFIRVK